MKTIYDRTIFIYHDIYQNAEFGNFYFEQLDYDSYKLNSEFFKRLYLSCKIYNTQSQKNTIKDCYKECFEEPRCIGMSWKIAYL